MKRSILIGLLFSCVSFATAQAPNAFNYQAVARDASGDPILNQSISVLFEIRPNSALDPAVYSETHSVNTNEYGLFDLQIGQGTATLGDFAEIDWSGGNMFLEVSMDISGGSSYQSMGTQQLISVPYALYATKAGSSDPLQDSSLIVPYCFPIGTDVSAQYNPAGGVGQVFGNDIWQSFTVNSSGDLNKVYFNIGTAPIATGTMEIYEGEGISGTLLGSRIVPDGNGHRHLFLNPTIPVTEGAQYTFRLTAPSNFHVAVQNTEGGYDGGVLSQNNSLDAIFDTRIINACIDSTTTVMELNDTTGLFLNRVGQILFDDGTAMTTAAFPDHIKDKDEDTFIHVEENTDEDIIRISTNGTEYFTLDSGRINIVNTGNSVFVGDGAGASDDLSDRYNTFIGASAGNKTQTGNYNVALGYLALEENVIGTSNVALGRNALRNNLDSRNIGLGSTSLVSHSTGTDNIGIGANAGQHMQSGSGNVLIGYRAGRGTGSHTKSNNVMIGHNAGEDNNSTGSVFIGANAGRYTSAGDRLYIENSSSSSPLIYGEFDNDLVRVNGDLTVRDDLNMTNNDIINADVVNAVSFVGDGSSLTGIVGDDLGDHTATQALDLSGNDVLNADTISATTYIGDGSNLTGIPDEDDQTLALTGNSLSIESGNAVDLTTLLLPVGSITMWPTETPPTGWLICNGNSFNAATYPELNAVLGGNNTPNLKGRFALGAKPAPVGAGQTAYEVGDTGGEEEHTLTIAEMPAHSHGIQYREGSEQGNGNDYSDLGDTGVNDSTQSAGGGQPHNNMPPYLVINYIIKAN